MFSPQKQDYNYKFKIVLTGDAAVGKTKIVERYTEKTYNDEYCPTIAFCQKTKNVSVRGQKCRVEILDSAGEDRYRLPGSKYYEGADGLLLVYDVQDVESFRNLDMWLTDSKRYNRRLCVAIVGNKIDTEKYRIVSTKRGEEFAESKGLKFFEVSAKENIKIKKIFRYIVSTLYRKQLNKKPIENLFRAKDYASLCCRQMVTGCPSAEKANDDISTCTCTRSRPKPIEIPS